jgi:hypothetical protein
MLKQEQTEPAVTYFDRTPPSIQENPGLYGEVVVVPRVQADPVEGVDFPEPTPDYFSKRMKIKPEVLRSVPE